jgi:hypothetical protein
MSGAAFILALAVVTEGGSQPRVVLFTGGHTVAPS